MIARARGLLRARREERVERGLVVGRRGRGQGHVGRRDAVEHAAPHVRRELALVLERDARAVRRADEVDALGTERRAHGVEVLHRDRRREESEVARGGNVRQLQKRVVALHREPELALGIGLIRERLLADLRTLQRRRSPGAALIDEDDVAPVVESREERHRRRGDRDRALPRAAGQQENRVGMLAPRHRRHDDVVDVDRRARRLARIERPAHRSAQHAVAQAGDVAFGERRVGRPDLGFDGVGPCGTERRGPGQSARSGDARQRRHSPSVRLNSPPLTSFSSSCAPPISWPLTKTIGKVGQPAHIFSALRRRHSLK